MLLKMLLNHAESVIINTGNLISSKELKIKTIQTPTEEVFDSISTTFLSWLSLLKDETFNDSTCQESKTVYCVSPHAIKVNQSDRAELKVSIKIFLGHYDCEDLKASILETMDSLDVNVVDSLILSLPLSLEEKFNFKKLKPLWTVLENLVHEGKLITIGISDLDTPELAELYELAEIKPSINQVNIESCCVMPPELTAFAKEHDIQLLTHNDPKVLVPDKMLHNILESAVATSANWKISWIVRYAVVIKCRGIIQNKGYLMCTKST